MPCGFAGPTTRLISDPSPPAIRVEVFFDGECPLCMREIRVLRRLDGKGHIRFTGRAHQWGAVDVT